MHAQSREQFQREAEERTKKAGYANGGRLHSDVKDGDEAQDKRMVTSAVRQHEEHDHKGEPLTKLKLRRGGRASLVDGASPTHSNGKRARGKSGVTLVIHNQPMAPMEKAAAQKQGVMQGMRLGAALGARQAARHMAAPPPRMAPPQMPTAAPGAGPMMPPRPGQLPTAPMGAGPMATGGRIKVKAHSRRKAGGGT
ncbi:MAG: hypothetical protein KGL26_01040 [Pseudomonadota bacterium]|nr:hypothetical protein [Pseudomonadota bacterium]